MRKLILIAMAILILNGCGDTRPAQTETITVYCEDGKVLMKWDDVTHSDFGSGGVYLLRKEHGGNGRIRVQGGIIISEPNVESK